MTLKNKNRLSKVIGLILIGIAITFFVMSFLSDKYEITDMASLVIFGIGWLCFRPKSVISRLFLNFIKDRFNIKSNEKKSS